MVQRGDIFPETGGYAELIKYGLQKYGYLESVAMCIQLGEGLSFKLQLIGY